MCSASRLRVPSIAKGQARWNRSTGAVLLEVVLALALFVGATAVLTSGLRSSLDAVHRLRLQTQAADRAVSVLSELQMGIKTLAIAGPQPFDPLAQEWTWETIPTPALEGENADERYQRIEVIIRHLDSGLVYRLSQVLRIDSAQIGERDGTSRLF